MASFAEVDRFVQHGRRSMAAQDALDYRDTYEGDHERFIAANPDEDPSDFAQRPKQWLNFTGQIVNTLSGLYQRDPTREFASDELEATYDAIYSANQVDLGWLEVDASTRLLGVSAWQGFWDEIEETVGLRVLTRDNFEVWTMDGRPDQAEFVLVHLWRPGDDGRRRAELYSSEFVWTYEAASESSSVLERVGLEENPYGRLPFVFTHNRKVTDSFFTPGIALNVCPQNWVIDKKLTELVQTQINRSYPQRWAKGLDPGEVITEGFRRWIHLSHDESEVGQLSPDIALAEIFDTIERELDLLLATNGIPKNAFRLNVSATSGVQVRAEQEPLVSDRRRRTKIFEPAEAELAQLVQVIHTVQSTSIPEDLGFSITFRPEPEPVPGPEQTADQQFLLDNKIASRVDIRMERHPDETREEAEAALEQVDEDNAAAPKPAEQVLFGGRMNGFPMGDDDGQVDN